MKAASVSLLLVLALFSAGCFRMTIINGNEVASAPVAADKWRSSAVLDIVAIDSPFGLDTACKETGWAKIHQEHSALDYLVDVFLAGWVYESTHADIYCAKRGTAAPLQGGQGASPALPLAAPPNASGTPTQPPTQL